MYTIKKRLGELLLESGMITEAQLQTALEEQQRSRKKLGDVLLEQGVLTEHQLIEALEFQLGIPHATLARLETDPKLTEVVSEQMAKRHQVLPIRVDGRKLMVAMADPLDLFVIEDLRISTGFTIEPAIISRGELQRGIARLYGQQDSGHEGAGSSQIEVEDSMILDEDSPVVRLVQQMIEQAVRLGASDIHVDPMDAQLTVRYRVDGQLRKGRSIPKSMQSVITARLKILAHLNIEERRLPQSGRIKLSVGGKPIDVRLSSLPTVHGEQIVMRLFDPSGGIQSLDKLGMTGENLELFRRMAGKRRGMICWRDRRGAGNGDPLLRVAASEPRRDERDHARRPCGIHT
ncbi:hypothetical protein HMSSN036_50360 [Paenibacillus macerans]|nr:hypothetical protein HMSSN036_50360 [Paenibacillus macerans]